MPSAEPTPGATLELGAEGPLSTRTYGGFVLREMVGAGGFGDVYLAHQIALGREAVVKVLRPDEMTAERVERFLREAQLASRLDHPYAAHVYAFGAEPDGVCWIAMERVRGASLRALIETQGPMQVERFAPLLERICEVVHTAHEQGIVHRDLKPDNVMVISRAGRLLPKLLDFGIARALDVPSAAAPVPLLRGELDGPAGIKTRAGAVLGSPPYMAPELWVDPHKAGPAADQYALAALAYEALTGRLAFPGRTVLEIARAHARTVVAPLGDGLPAELDQVLRRALAKKQAERYANVLELAQAFRDASGIGAGLVEIPQLDDQLRQRFLASAPQPIADAVAAYDAARNAHQAREALRGVVRIAAWYVGILTLACRTRVGSGGVADSEHALMLLRDLRRQGLTPAGWIALARQLALPFARSPDTFPVPELVLLFQPAGARGADPFAACLEGSLSESLPDSSEDAAAQAIARELPTVTALLAALTFLFDYPLVVARDGGGGEAWSGARSGPRPTVALGRSVPAGRPVVVDGSGTPILVLWPLVQIATPVPGHAEQAFLVAGPGRQGARLVSSPHGFEHHDPALWDWFRDHLLAAEDAAAGAAVAESPYRGLAAYTAGDSGWFFGRERETEVVVNRLKLEPFVAVVGPSGVGKSSFVHAGVAPALAGWQVVTLRPGRAPMAQLAQSLRQAGVDVDADAATGDPAAIAGPLRAWAASAGGAVVVVDQFEEVFTLGCPPEERDRFARTLLAAARAGDDPVRVVITLRDDFLIRAEQLPGLDLALARGLQLLGPLGPAALERILIEPARRAGYDFEDPALPAEMVAAVEGTHAAVALISFTAARLWELRDRHFHQLQRKAYEAIGGVGGALARHADETVDAMPGAERALVRKVFRHLVTFAGTRAVLTRAELEQLVGPGPDAARLIERLVAARLVSSAENDRGEVVVEIVHEALLDAWPRLAEWRREDVEGSRLHEQLRAAARQWEDRGRPRGLLWRGDALAEYELWRRRHTANLTPLESAFGAASTADAARGRRLRRAGAAVALAITAVFVVVLLRANRAEKASRRDAVANADRALALLRDSYFEQGRLLVLQGDKRSALADLTRAYDMGEVGAPIRLLIEEASRSARARAQVLAHGDKVWDAVYSPDGTRIATASADGKTRIWNAADGTLVDSIDHGAPVVTAAFSPDGKLLAAGDWNQKVRLWDVAARREVAALEFGHRLYRVVFDARSAVLAATGQDGAARAWRLADLAPVDLPGHAGMVQVAACTRAACLVTADEAGTVIWWDLATLHAAATYHHGSPVIALAVDSGGARAAIGTATGELVVLGPDGRPIAKRAAHDSLIFDVAFSPDGTVVATGSDDHTAKLWDAATAAPRATLSGHRANVTAVRFSPDGTVVVTASADSTVRLWSAATGNLIGDLSGHASIVFAPSFRADGARLVTPSWDHQAIVWDTAAARQFLSFERARADTAFPAVGFAAGGDRVALIAADGSLVVADSATGATRCRARAAHAIDAFAWSADGARLATVGQGDPGVRVWSATTCAAERTVDAGPALAIAWTATGQLITGGEDRTLRLWDADGSERELSGLPGAIDSVGAEPGGGRIWATTVPAEGHPAAVVLGDPTTGVRTGLDAGPMPITAVAFDRGHHRILASSFDQKLRIWDETTGALVTTLEASGPLFGLAVSPDGSRVVGLGGLAPIAWDTTTGATLGSLEGHADLVVAGGFLDDAILMTASRDGTARVWDVTTRRSLLVFGGVGALAFGGDRSAVVMSGEGGTRLWRPRFPVRPVHAP